MFPGRCILFWEVLVLRFVYFLFRFAVHGQCFCRKCHPSFSSFLPLYCDASGSPVMQSASAPPNQALTIIYPFYAFSHQMHEENYVRSVALCK